LRFCNVIAAHIVIVVAVALPIMIVDETNTLRIVEEMNEAKEEGEEEGVE
jgi:hypothetical protein